MSLETASRIGQLVPSNPSGADLARTADDHLRLIKALLVSRLGEADDEPLTIKFSQLNKLLESTTPIGTIVAFGLPVAQVPAGWALCDGRTVDRSDGTAKITTPDLRARAIVGASDDRPAGTKFGQTSRTVTSEGAGNHRPAGKVSLPAQAGQTVTVRGQTGNAKTGVTASATNDTVDNGGSAPNIAKLPITINDPGHVHSFEGSANIEGRPAQDLALSMEDVPAHGHSVTVNLEQPSVTVNWIMKV